jgi:hypothetical protein
MRRVALCVGLAAACLVFASQAAAATTQVSMTFTEPGVANIKQGCPFPPNGYCGNGVVLPFGHATETVQFGAGCGGSCDVRTIYLPSGTITSHEQSTGASCPGACQPNPAEPGVAFLSDTIVGGTGSFSGAGGSLSGMVRLGGLASVGSANIIHLTGTITLP